MITNLKTVSIKAARIQHVCDCCLFKINPGEGYLRHKMAGEGSVYDFLQCEWCQEHMSECDGCRERWRIHEFVEGDAQECRQEFELLKAKGEA